MIDPEFKKMIKAAVINGSITDKKRAFILDKAKADGYDVDEVEIVLESFLTSSNNQKSPTPQKETVKKCPACGATITFQSKCPECGYVFTSLKANESSSLLYEELKKLGTRKINKKRQLIESFPIPNTKADILEFLLLLRPKACDSKDLLVDAYLNKYQECLERAKTFFGDDPDFAPFIEAFPKMKANLKHGALSRWIKSHVFLTIIIVWFALCLLSMLLSLSLYDFSGYDMIEDDDQTPTEFMSQYDPADDTQELDAEGLVDLLDSNFVNEAKSSLEEEDDPDLEDLVLVLEIRQLLEDKRLHDAMAMAERVNSKERREQLIDIVKSDMVDSLVSIGEYDNAASLARTLTSETDREEMLQYVSRKKDSNSAQ